MKILSFSSVLSVFGAAAWVSLLASPVASGQVSVATTPVGFLQTQCLSNSDTLVAPPFTRPVAFTGAVSSISGSTITFSNGSLTADAYDAPTTTPPTKDTYYLSIGPATATLMGTVSVTQGSMAVTGSGTNFGNDVKVGDRITINDGYSLLTYTVVSIASMTSLTLDRAFSDSAAPGGTTSAVSSTKAAAVRTTAIKTAAVKPVAANSPVASGTSTLSGLTATFDHCPYEGRFYQVISNTAGSVTLNLNNDNLSSVAVGTQVSIIPYWTLNSIYPTGSAGVSLTASPSSFVLHTQILIPNYSGVGTDLASSTTYYYLSSGSGTGWRLYGDANTTDHGYDSLLPDGYYIVRNDASSPTLSVTFAGVVPLSKQVITLATNASAAQDNEVSLVRPADMMLSALGLGPNDNSFRVSASSFNLVDQLFVYDNMQVAVDKVPIYIYYYISNGTNVGWRRYGDASTTDHGTDLVPAGSALTIRKSAATGVAQNPVWTNSPNY